MRQDEIAEYIVGMTMPLCYSASDAGLKTLAYLLEMAVLEAKNVQYLAREEAASQRASFTRIRRVTAARAGALEG